VPVVAVVFTPVHDAAAAKNVWSPEYKARLRDLAKRFSHNEFLKWEKIKQFAITGKKAAAGGSDKRHRSADTFWDASEAGSSR
jgi:hypothetical protein